MRFAQVVSFREVMRRWRVWGLEVGDDVSGGVGSGLGAEDVPEVLVVGKHSLAVWFVMQQAVEFVCDVFSREATGDEFLDGGGGIGWCRVV